MLPQRTDRAHKTPTRSLPPLTPTPKVSASNATPQVSHVATSTLSANLTERPLSQQRPQQQHIDALHNHARERTARRQRHAATLMHDCSITAEQEAEIFSAFEFLAIRNLEEYESERPIGVLPLEDLNTILELLDVYMDEEDLLKAHRTVDPLESGFVTYKILCQFVALLKYHPDSDTTTSSDVFQEEQSTIRSPEVQTFLAREKQEIRNLFRYFTRGTSASTSSDDTSRDATKNQPLTLTHLRSIKSSVDRKHDPLMLSRSRIPLEEESDEEGEDPDADLKTMILDANLSEDKKNGWRAGVTFEEFEEAMRRLPMFTPSMNH